MSKLRFVVLAGVLIFISVVLVCVAAWMFWQVRTILLYLIIAAIFTMITRPVEKLLEKIRIGKRKIPRSIRSVIILIGIYLIIFSFIAIFIPLFVDEANIISNVNSSQVSAALHGPITQAEQTFASFHQSNADHETLEQYVQSAAGQILTAASVTSMAHSLVSMFGSLLISFFAISFFTFFFLKDGPAILEMLLLLVPTKHVKSVRNIITESQVMLGKYFAGVLLDVLFVSTFVSTCLYFLGVQNALIIGFFAGIMNIVPYVGPLIGGSFAIVIGVSSNLSLDFYTGIVPLIEKILVVFVTMNLLDAFFVQPFIFSKRVKAHPIEIFAVILIAGTLTGIGGMIVAVPVYTIVRIIAREFFSKYRFVQRLTNELDEAADPDHKLHPQKIDTKTDS